MCEGSEGPELQNKADRLYCLMTVEKPKKEMMITEEDNAQREVDLENDRPPGNKDLDEMELLLDELDDDGARGRSRNAYLNHKIVYTTMKNGSIHVHVVSIIQ